MEVFYEKGRKYNCYKKGLPYFRITATIDGKRHTVYGNGKKDAKKKIEELKALSTNSSVLSIVKTSKYINESKKQNAPKCALYL